MHKYEKVKGKYHNTFKVVFLESSDNDVVVYERKLDIDSWKRAHELLGPEFMEMNSVDNQKLSNHMPRIIEYETPENKKILVRTTFNYGKEKEFAAIWKELRSFGVWTVRFRWKILDANNKPLKRVSVRLYDNSPDVKSKKDGSLRLDSSIIFFDRSKNIAFIWKDGYSTKTIEYDLSKFEYLDDPSYVIRSNLVINLESIE